MFVMRVDIDGLEVGLDAIPCAAVGLYAFLGFLMDGPATLATSLIGLRISPHFDEPYRSHSIASFWGRRWNLTASNALRVLVYDTTCDGAACICVDHRTQRTLHL